MPSPDIKQCIQEDLARSGGATRTQSYINNECQLGNTCGIRLSRKDLQRINLESSETDIIAALLSNYLHEIESLLSLPGKDSHPPILRKTVGRITSFLNNEEKRKAA